MDLDSYLNFNEPGHPISDNSINNGQNIGICMNDQNLRRELLGKSAQTCSCQQDALPSFMLRKRRPRRTTAVHHHRAATRRCRKRSPIVRNLLILIQAQGNGQVRVFIIRDQVKNVIQAGNNLIVETGNKIISLRCSTFSREK
jgi:hypothetical protein